MMIDRAELACRDGATHHGIFDVSFLSHIPNISIFAPATYGSLREAIRMSVSSDLPIAIRYANKSQSDIVDRKFYPDGNYTDFGVVSDFDKGRAPKCIFVTYGNIAERVLAAEEILVKAGVDAGTVLVEALKPYEQSCEKLSGYIENAERILFVEEGIKNGGYSMISKDILESRGLLDGKKIDIVAIDDNFAVPDMACDIYDYLGLSAEKIAKRMMDLI